tara:strand:+ start:530 stop:715 length:186 start_codon:yes stop_codon:yes gene_type:complete
MIIIKDIQDALTMRKTLSGIARRAFIQEKSRTQLIIELLEVCEDLEKNIEREERSIQEEAA